MKARFCNGPYDKVTLYVTDGIDHIRLPIRLTTTIMTEMKTFDGSARYDLTMYNEFEATFQFRGIELGP